MQLQELQLTDYFKLATARKTALANYAFKYVLLGAAKLYGCKEQDEVRAFAIVKSEASIARLLYVDTAPAWQKQGYATALLAQLKQKVKQPLQVNLAATLTCAPRLQAIIQHLGYQKLQRSTIFTIACNATNRSRFLSEDEGRCLWARLTQRILHQGRQCLPWTELTPAQKQTLLRAEGHRFNPTNFFNDKNKGLAPELSYALFNGSNLDAYSLLTRLKRNHVVIEIFSTREDKLHSGCIIAPFYASIMSMLQLYYPLVTKISFTVYATNKAALATFSHFMEQLHYTTQQNDIYLL